MHMFTYAWSKKERWTADTQKLSKSGHDQISESGGKWLRSELVLCTKAGEGRAEKEFHKRDEVSQSVSPLFSVAPYLSPEKNWRPRLVWTFWSYDLRDDIRPPSLLLLLCLAS